MMKKTIFGLLIAFVATSMLACTKVVPITDLVKKSWSVQSARENGVDVYTKGGANNKVSGYSNFNLNLIAGTTFTMTEVDNNKFSGQYTISTPNDKAGTGTINLKGVSPVPTGTTGSIDFSITSLTATQMTLTRNSTNQKTGATSTEYVLVTQ